MCKEDERNNILLQDTLNQISDLFQKVIAEEKFDIKFENPHLERCWEVMQCHKEGCPCFGQDAMRCWQKSGTFCRGEVQGVFAQKIGNCLLCKHYKKTVENPIVQIGEQFNNMMHILREKNGDLKIAYEKTLGLTADLQRKIRQLEAYDHLQQHLMTFHPLDETLQLLVREVQEVSEAERVRIYLLANEAISLAMSNLDKEQQAILEGNIPVSQSELTWCQDVAQKGQPVCRPYDEAEASPKGMEAVYLPIVKYGETLGILQILLNQEASEDEELLQCLNNFATLAATAIQDSRCELSAQELEPSFEEMLKSAAWTHSSRHAEKS